MSQFDKIIALSRKLAKAALKGKKTASPEKFDDILNKREGEDILTTLHHQSYWSERKKFLNEINTNKEWKILEKKISPGKTSLTYFKYAATVAIIIGVALFFLLRNYSDTPANTIVAGTEKAVLTLENGQQVALSKETSYSDKNATAKNSQLVYRAVESPESKTYNFLTVPRGGQFVVELSDHTQVWLNSESKLRYPVQFTVGETRAVELVYGEAYFDVSPSTENEGDAFTVVTKSQHVQVLGTEFNIEAYRDEEQVYTTLNKGSVTVENSFTHRVLAPGEQAITHAGDSAIVVNAVNVESAIAWKNGLFVFDEEPLYEMMDELSRWYDVDIVFKDDKKKNYHFSGELNREANVQELLENIEKTGEVDFTITDKQILIE